MIGMLQTAYANLNDFQVALGVFLKLLERPLLGIFVAQAWFNVLHLLSPLFLQSYG
jgi:hypothetical protein